MIVQAGYTNIYFMVIERLCTKNEFVVAARVRPDSHGAEIASRIYWCLFGDATDVCLEFERYYKIEYDNIWRYLKWHYAISDGLMKYMKKVYRPGMHILYGDVYSGGDLVVGQYITGDEGLAIIEHIIRRATRWHAK